ncbi:MAG: ATP-binding protein [Solobacterium sp.]|jgi:primosomal protein DnaI|nr:ATP-binding protein [Solobacterium sp.]
MEKPVFQTFRTDGDPAVQKAELISSLKQDSRVRQLFADQAIPAEQLETSAYLFEDWRTRTAPCEGCTGLAQCRMVHQGMRQGLRYDGILKEVIEACPYRSSQDQLEAHCSKYLVSDLSEDMKTVSFENIKLDQETGDYMKSMSAAIQACISNRGVYLYGNMGTGKSYLAACASNYHARNNESCAFVHCPSFCARVSATMRSGEYRTEAERMSFVKFLVIDDIGAEEVTDRSRALLLSILDSRMQNHLCTWFTSNEDYDSLKNHFITTGRGEDSLQADRVMERIKALSIQIHLIGRDRRDIGR